MQILTSPFHFGITTIPTHQSVGSLIFVMTPSLSILWSSSLTLGWRGITNLLGVVRAYGVVFPSAWWCSYLWACQDLWRHRGTDSQYPISESARPELQLTGLPVLVSPTTVSVSFSWHRCSVSCSSRFSTDTLWTSHTPPAISCSLVHPFWNFRDVCICVHFELDILLVHLDFD